MKAADVVLLLTSIDARREAASRRHSLHMRELDHEEKQVRKLCDHDEIDERIVTAKICRACGKTL